MYSTCIFCHSALGANDAVEHFTVGRRLAFDAQRGRLWVVCRKCERWNLTPIEERWEAIDDCERLFRSTKLRVSTDNIGLARIREGLELVRIGAPQRPEMAAWRYGDQFGRRRRKHLMYTGVGVAAAVGIIGVGPALGVIAGGSWGLWNLISASKNIYDQRRVRARIVLPEFDEPLHLRLKQLNRVGIVYSDDTWALKVPFESPAVRSTQPPIIRALRPLHWTPGVERTILITGDAALRAAGMVLPAINVSGAKRDEVNAAVRLIEDAPEPSSLFARYSGRPKSEIRRRRTSDTGDGRPLANLPKEVRLALEMASHEESERRALEGELSILETAWQDAEEIAAISDDLFVSDATRDKLADLKRDDAGD